MGIKIVNAKLYEKQIREKMWEAWYDEKYQYYFGVSWRNDFSIGSDGYDYQERAFAVLNDQDELLGYISYSVDNELRIAENFGAINFSDDKITFGNAIYQIIAECFIKFGLEVVEWRVVCGNPVERSYDRLCRKLGGNIIGVRHGRAMDLSGNILNDKLYEILRDDFIKYVTLRRERMLRNGSNCIQ